MKSSTEIWETQDSLVEEIYIHPQYDPKTVTNNLAILRTQDNFIYEEHIGPVCLPRLLSRQPLLRISLSLFQA